MRKPAQCAWMPPQGGTQQWPPDTNNIQASLTALRLCLHFLALDLQFAHHRTTSVPFIQKKTLCLLPDRGWQAQHAFSGDVLGDLDHHGGRDVPCVHDHWPPAPCVHGHYVRDHHDGGHAHEAAAHKLSAKSSPQSTPIYFSSLFLSHTAKV